MPHSFDHGDQGSLQFLHQKLQPLSPTQSASQKIRGKYRHYAGEPAPKSSGTVIPQVGSHDDEDKQVLVKAQPQPRSSHESPKNPHKKHRIPETPSPSPPHPRLAVKTNPILPHKPKHRTYSPKTPHLIHHDPQHRHANLLRISHHHGLYWYCYHCCYGICSRKMDHTGIYTRSRGGGNHRCCLH